MVLFIFTWRKATLTLDILFIVYFFPLNQLDYVIYRRVLRYYSGEEDGLGESTRPKRTK